MTDKKPQGIEQNWSQQTRMVHGGTTRSAFGETSEAIFATSGYVYQNAEEAEARFKGEQDGYIYSRFDNPTVSMFEQRMCELEGAEAARATASGMAAIHAVLFSCLKSGDHILTSKALFGSSRYILQELCPRFGIEYTLVDGEDNRQWEEGVRPNTKLLFLETPSNPQLTIIDVAHVASVAKAADALLVVDNVFATPILQRPLEFGADVVVYSGTKHIDGQGRCLGGVVLGSADFIYDTLKPYLRNTGPALSPFNAWVMLKSLETLDLRMRQHCKNAETVAAFLSEHDQIERALYPTAANHPQCDLARRQMTGGGSVVAFDVKGGKSSAFNVANALQLIKISNNLGDAKSLLTHPATTTHQRIGAQAREEMGIGDSMLRISVGLEDPDDICRDLDQALRQL